MLLAGTTVLQEGRLSEGRSVRPTRGGRSRKKNLLPPPTWRGINRLKNQSRKRPQCRVQFKAQREIRPEEKNFELITKGSIKVGNIVPVIRLRIWKLN